MKDTFQIDWRSSLGTITHLLDGSGGIALVRAGEFAAGNTFLKSIRAEMRRRGCLTAQLNPEDPRANTAKDIVHLLSDELGISISGSVATTGTRADHGPGSVVFQPTDGSDGLNRALKRIAEHIEEKLKSTRIALFVINIHGYPERMLTWFWQDMWDDYFSHLVGDGLLLFLLTAPAANTGLPSGYHEICVTIDLPDLYAGEDLDHATEDIAQILLDRGIAVDAMDARGRAETYLASTECRPALTHDQLIGTISRLLTRQQGR